jgi:hypothetical protein
MTVIRQYMSGADPSGPCGSCNRAAPEITIEDHPQRKGIACLCRTCAANDFRSDLVLASHALVALIIKNGTVNI